MPRAEKGPIHFKKNPEGVKPSWGFAGLRVSVRCSAKDALNP